MKKGKAIHLTGRENFKPDLITSRSMEHEISMLKIAMQHLKSRVHALENRGHAE